MGGAEWAAKKKCKYVGVRSVAQQVRRAKTGGGTRHSAGSRHPSLFSLLPRDVTHSASFLLTFLPPYLHPSLLQLPLERNLSHRSLRYSVSLIARFAFVTSLF
ncbi:hypothetical protein E2C01_038608 [Portunus trituberculatus]|uniref:Uncharacterized protein n=1 Tax=Portunus trituberculatus TaxID=210409 RepID=A0A5B7FHM7_PORTR|nr:hypothetical protein [Portunus trituberculatus]